ncbi:MAG: Gfo/Idh/MocA family oxidoreductase [Sphingomonadaceae bacterium]|nr:Gfo/Idh/MocA family oxidoreductase [Sphingomonadaceae bacterium]
MAGFGWVARDYFAPALAEAGGRLAAVADPSRSARAAAEALGAAAHIEPSAAIAHADALYVATPNHLHRAPVVAALEAGVPVLCEKPMAASAADARAIADSARRTGTLYGTAFDQRWHPVHQRMAALVAAGAIGRATAVRILYCCWLGPDWGPDNWRADPEAAGGGAVIDLAPHGLDLVHALLGEPVAELDICLQRRVHAYAVEDGGLLMGATASGVLVQAHVAYNCPEALPRRRLEVVGTEGALFAENSMGQTPGGVLTRICGRTGTAETVAVPNRSPFAVQIEAFHKAMRSVSPRSRIAELDRAQTGGGAPGAARGACGPLTTVGERGGPPPRAEPQEGERAFSAERDLALTRLLFEAYGRARCR